MFQQKALIGLTGLWNKRRGHEIGDDRLGLLWRSGQWNWRWVWLRHIVHICKTVKDILKDNVKLA